LVDCVVVQIVVVAVAVTRYLGGSCCDFSKRETTVDEEGAARPFLSLRLMNPPSAIVLIATSKT
jgi:hypothetical protein